MRTFALLALAGALAFAQQTQTPVKPEDPCTIEGSVVNARTQEPLKRAQVVATRADGGLRGSAGTMTDGAGKFKLINIDAGSYHLSVSKTGFVTESGPTKLSQAFPLVRLTAGQAFKGVLLKMSPGAVITGRVLDEDGEPMANVQIDALVLHYVGGQRQWLPENVGTSDDQGNYRISGLRAGRYSFKARLAEYGRNTMVVDHSAQPHPLGYAEVYYPGVNDLSQAGSVQLRAGEEKRAIDFRMIPVRTVHIRGRVLGPPGTKLRSVGLILANRDVGFRGAFGIRPVQEDGTFDMSGLSAGAYDVAAFMTNGAQQLSGNKSVDVADRDVDGVEIVLGPGIEIRGELRLEVAAAGSKTSLEDFRVSMGLKQQSVVGQFSSGGEVQSDGTFTLKGVGDGDYTVSVWPLSGNNYVKAIRIGSTDALTEGVRVSDGAAPGTLEIVISPNGGKLQGTVRGAENKPVPGATVALVPEVPDSSGQRYKMAQSDQNGHYVVSAIPPGGYKVYAWTEVENGAWQDPAFLEGYKDHGQRVKLEEKAQETLDLTALTAADSGG